MQKFLREKGNSFLKNPGLRNLCRPPNSTPAARSRSAYAFLALFNFTYIFNENWAVGCPGLHALEAGPSHKNEN